MIGNIVEKGEEIVLHLTYNENLTFHELTLVIECINRALNDTNRENEVLNKEINEFSPVVNRVENGSIIFNIISKFACKVGMNVIIEMIKKRFKKDSHFEVDFHYEKREKDSVHILNINVTKDVKNK